MRACCGVEELGGVLQFDGSYNDVSIITPEHCNAPMNTSEAHELLETHELLTFAATGAVNATQDLVRHVRAGVEGADAELVAEETLVLVAVATSRAVEVGLRSGAPAEAREQLCEALLALPFTYRDYLTGRAMLAQGEREAAGAMAEDAQSTREGLERKRQFYTSHLPAGRFPGEHALSDKMALWMGRISPPKLPEMPQERLEKLELVDPLVAHLKVVLAAARRRATTGETADGEQQTAERAAR